MTELSDRLWAWFNGVVGRPYELQTWDCFQLLLEGQNVAGWHRAYEPSYRATDKGSAETTLLRNFARGFRQFKRIDEPQLGAAVLFRVEKVPVHVGIWMAPNLMAHVNTTTATTLAEIGPGTDYHFNLEGFYVPK